MTVLEDRIEMAESGDELTLDMMFEWLEKMPVPEGYKAEIVGGHVFMTPQRDTHWDIIADIYYQLRAENPRKRLKSDVRIDYPGHLNGFASDVTLLAEGATKNDKGRWRCEDVVFIA